MPPLPLQPTLLRLLLMPPLLLLQKLLRKPLLTSHRFLPLGRKAWSGFALLLNKECEASKILA